MNNENIVLQYRGNTRNIRSILIIFMIAFSVGLITITHVKDESVIETRENTEVQTSTTATTTTSIPVTSYSQDSDTNSYVSNYFNAWELTKVI